MTRQETGIIMDILTTAYPRFYAGSNSPDMLKTINLWSEMFCDDPVEVVAAAVKLHISTDEKGFPPHIGAIKASIAKIKQPNVLTEIEAWELVQKAIRNSAYESAQEFAKLPLLIQRLVGSPNQLKEWSMMDADTVGSVVASNFQRSYKVRAEKEREYLSIPSDVRAILGRASESMSLESGADRQIGNPDWRTKLLEYKENNNAE